ncbi:hypothetical protein SAMN04487900_1392 [Prevotella communis]|uniref:Uncharacterized protein n=1 Tax=Prevotella communis TaxID=2913614 RepID=A0A1H0L0T2_9BACT|nr:hypothetical protein [Prevotella communis]SDO61646.1 hypothetical protein SAMN04487900_1392 [Prevotella communis]
MKTISRYIMTLALLLTAVTGAWADELSESFTTNHEVSVYTGEHFKITVGDVGSGKGFYLAENKYATIEALNGEIITKVELTKGYYYINNFYCEVGTTNISGDVATVSGVNNTSLTFTASGALQIKAVKVYYTAPEPAVEVTINEAKSEASFQMPQYDVTATYTIKRDISVDVTAQVGDGTDGVRYRVKKDGNNKFIPADMEMAAVPALFTVNDDIEQKALTQTQDYIVQIYAIDAEGQSTGDPMTFATFTFEPGIYAVKAVAADGSDYAGETALSNTFQLFQGYQVEVAAKEFITYYKDEPLYADTETSADAELYTISSVNGDQATLSAAIETAPSRTPLLIFNNSDEAKTFLLIPANAEPNLQLTVAPEFVGTLEATTIAASTDDQNNYALNGKAFVFVKNDLPVGANKAWLSISTGVPSARITLVFDETTKIANTNITNITNGEWYTIDGRKVNAPSKKGIYIMNGKKVVVK